MSRRRHPGTCEKVQIHSDGMAILGCRDSEGQPVMHCSEAGNYRDSALPLSEQLCRRTIGDHTPHMSDTYKEPYVRVCHNIDETLADQYKAGSAENLDLRFEAMERSLQEMIDDPELSRGDNGRYLYHIDARVLHAFLPAYWYRASNDIGSPMPITIIEDAYERISDILQDFSSTYRDVATQVALRRTEVEMLALLLRTKNPDFFPFPTLFREDASETREYNHDAYVIMDGTKVRIQITNADYKLPSGKKKSESYDQKTVIAIHQHVVNLDYKDGETVITPISTEPAPIRHEHHVIDTYEDFAEDTRYVAWGAHATGDEENVFEEAQYIQVLGGTRRDGLSSALIKEANGKKLTIDERNSLNGASHYLLALVRQKQAEL